MRPGADESESRTEAVVALRLAAHAVLASQDFSAAAVALLHLTKGAVAAEAVDLTFRLDAEPELFADGESALEPIDGLLSPALRSLRREACRARRAVLANGLAASGRGESSSLLDSVLFAPVLLAGECMGVLSLANAAGGFCDHDKEVAAAFAELLAVAWRTHQAVRREARRSSQQAALTRLGRMALGEHGLQPILDEATATLARELDVSLVGVFEVDGEVLRLRAGVGWAADVVGKATVSAGADSMAGLTLRRAEPLLVDDLRADPRFSTPHLWLEHGASSGMSMVVGEPRARFGVISVHTVGARRFTHDDVIFLEAVANVVGEAVGRQQADRQRRQEAARHAKAVSVAVVEASVHFLQARSVSAMARVLVEHAVRLVGAPLGMLATVAGTELYIHGLSTHAWDAAAGEGLRRKAEHAIAHDGRFAMPIGQSLLFAPLREGRVVLSNAARSDPRWRGRLPPGHPAIESYLAVPLGMPGRVVGMIALANKPGGFDALDAAGLETFAACATLAIHESAPAH